MASVGRSIDLRWGILQAGIPHIEFKYPVTNHTDIIRLYHGIQDNVPNRRIVKTTLRSLSAGNEYAFRNIGYSNEFTRVNIVLTTKREARSFTDFFKKKLFVINRHGKRDRFSVIIFIINKNILFALNFFSK